MRILIIFYVDNINNLLSGPGVIGSFKIQAATFKVNDLYVFPSDDGTNVSNAGTVIIRGKLGGIVQFTQTVGSGSINTDYGVNNGYTFVDLSANSLVSIDELEFEVTDNLIYLQIDAFRHHSIAAPSVTSVSVPSNGTYITGQNLDFTVNYSEAITVNTSVGTPSIPITLNTGGTVYASYISGSGTSSLVFRYTVAAGTLDTDGISIGSAITANGGTLKNSSSVDANLTFNSVGSTAAVLIDAVAPIVNSIKRQNPLVNTINANAVTFRITFSENVSNIDLSDFTLTTTGSCIGSLASLTSSTGTSIDVSLNSISGSGTIRLDLNDNGTGIVDNAGNIISAGYSSGETYTINRSPILTTTIGTTSFSEGKDVPSTPVFVDNGITVSDIDNLTLASASISIIGNFYGGEDVLSFTNSSAITFGNITASYNSGTGVLTMVSSGSTATIVQWQNALRAINYSNSSESPNTANRTISFTISDGISNSSTSVKLVSVSSINDSPVASTTAGTTSFVEGNNVISTPAVIDNGITVSDPDNSTLTSASIVITNNFSTSEDLLAFTNDGSTMGNIAGTFNASTGTLTLISSGATATLSQWQAALRAITYTNSSDSPNTANRTVSFTVSDGTDQSTLSTKTISVSSTNDKPIISTSAGTTSFTEADNVTSTPVILDNGITLSDLDNSTLGSATVSINSGLQTGQDVLAFTNTSSSSFGNIVASYNSATGVLTMTSSGATATLSQWQAALRSVTYFNSSDLPNTSNRTISITINDGSDNSTASAKTISIISTNDTPVATIPIDQICQQNSSLIFNSANTNLISVNDADANGGNLQITMTCTNGVLTLSSTTGLTFLVGDGTSDATTTFDGSLTNLNNALNGLNFVPTTGYDGTASLQITVSDMGNTGSGGTKTDTKTITLTIVSSEIAVEGNLTEITAGDQTPSLTDFTDFGLCSVSSETVTKTFTIKNTGTGDLILNGTPKVVVSGTNSADFTVSVFPETLVASVSGTTTFEVTFNPSGPGIRSATLSISNNDNNENPYNFSIQGMGTITPTVTTTLASSVSVSSAIVGGNISNDGGLTILEKGVVYSISDLTPFIGETDVTKVINSTNSNSFDETLSSLSSGLTYYFRAYAINSLGTSYGEIQDFTTLKLSAVATQAVNDISINSAIASGNITDLGISNPTAYGFCWSTTPNPTTANNKIDKGVATTAGTFSATLTGLAPYTTYFVRAYSTNAAGTSYGEQISFTTKGILAGVILYEINDIYATSAIGKCSIADLGFPNPTAYGICWSTNPGPTMFNSKIHNIGTATTTGTFNASISGLEPNTVYYARVYAANAEGIAYSDEISFKTTKSYPVISWDDPSDIFYGTTLTDLQLNATSNVDGSFEYTPAIGTKLNIGDAHELSVTFTPKDLTKNEVISKTVKINVRKAVPVIVWENPKDIVTGTALSGLQLNATSNVDGTFVYEPASGVILNTGDSQSLTVTFTPTDTEHYIATSNTVKINVVIKTGTDIKNQSLISLYPNPTTDKFYISGIEDQVDIRLFNLNGKLIFEKSIVDKEAISVESLPTGTYLVGINTKGTMIYYKLVKK